MTVITKELAEFIIVGMIAFLGDKTSAKYGKIAFKYLNDDNIAIYKELDFDEVLFIHPKKIES